MAPVSASLIFRLFDDETLRMRAITVVMIVGMTGFAFGPILAGAALTRVLWGMAVLVNVPLALIAWLGVRFGIPADQADELHPAPIDLPGAALTMAAVALASYTFTSGVEHGWLSTPTIGAALGAILAGIGFVIRERRAAHPMLDLALLRGRTVRGAALTQLGGSIAMIGSMFGLVLHFQYAYGWSPAHAGLANLPFVITMLAASPVAEQATKRFGHRMACVIGSALVVGSLAGMAWAVNQSYLPIAICMVGMTMGLRIIMTVCAVALIDAMPANQTSLGAAVNDTAQEIGTSVGVAVVGTVLAAVVGSALPDGAWSAELVATFFHGEQIAYGLLAVIVGLIAGYGSSTLTDSRSTEEAH